jgi:hypothetical protein
VGRVELVLEVLLNILLVLIKYLLSLAVPTEGHALREGFETVLHLLEILGRHFRVHNISGWL